MEQLLQNQVGIGFLAVWIIQRLKASGWPPWINDSTGKLNRFLSALAASLATVGITWNYRVEGGVLTISGLTLAGVAAFLSTLVSQGAIQEVLYQAAFKKPNGSPVAIPTLKP